MMSRPFPLLGFALLTAACHRPSPTPSPDEHPGAASSSVAMASAEPASAASAVAKAPSGPWTHGFAAFRGTVGASGATREVRLVPRDDDVAALKRIVGATGPILLVHPGSRSHWRLWPAERFAAVCDRAQEELGVQVVLVGGPGERALIESIRKFAHTHLLAFTDPFALTRFAALARLSSVLLCHDSGPMHVAAAVGTPVVALYGSQSSVLFPPAGSGHILLQPSLPCTECVAPAECVPLDSYHNQCVRRLTVEAVFAAVSRQFSRLKAPAS